MSSWQTLWHVLGFPLDINPQADNFQGQIHKLFPLQSQKTRSPTTFSISLSDLDNIDLRVKPTGSLVEHLLLEGDTVNVFKFAFEDIGEFREFKNNRAAR